MEPGLGKAGKSQWITLHANVIHAFPTCDVMGGARRERERGRGPERVCVPTTGFDSTS